MGLYLGDKLISSNLAGGDTNPIGSVIAFAGSNAPVGYRMCDGSAVSRETYAELFAVIGTTYGSGDGSTTFNLPNAQGRTLVGVDGSDADFDLADTGGEKTHTLTVTEMPSHRHYSGLYTVTDRFGSGTRDAAGTYSGYGGAINTGYIGGGGAHNNMPPFLSLNYIIKAKQLISVMGTGLADDFVVEEETSGDWTYRKWHSGKVEAWLRWVDFAPGTPSAWGQLFYKDTTLSIPSGIFSEKPTLRGFGCSGEGFCSAIWVNSATQIGLTIMQPTNASDKTFTLNAYLTYH